jgi:NADP-dependent 3-hydroxy acid dehydrogenase YdfG
MVAKVWKQIMQDHKRVNILVNNAAIARGKLLKDLSVD